jgi:hypothetical protein
MRPIRLTSRLIGKLHHAAQLETLPSWRIIPSYPRLQHLRNRAPQLSYLRNDVLLLLLRHSCFKPKRKHVYVHGAFHFWSSTLLGLMLTRPRPSTRRGL